MNSEIKVDKPSPSYLKRSNNGGLLVGLIYVLVLMAILALALWQKSEVDSKNISIEILDERIALLEEQLSLADENNMDSMSGVSSSLQFLDKEIRKLWDLSNKRNKVDINKLKDTEKLILSDIQTLVSDLDNLKILIDENKKSSITIRETVDLVKNDVDNLKDLSIRASNLETQLMLIEDSIQALENYKKQINQTILEVQTEITNMKSVNKISTKLIDETGI